MIQALMMADVEMMVKCREEEKNKGSLVEKKSDDMNGQIS
jgi:hypothetical protein